MSHIILKIKNVSKEYRLGQIGGTTLREELQRQTAKLLKKEDPTKKINAKEYKIGEKFVALDDICLDINEGERVGIIGHNGAGKSTLLKLISRVTAPTKGFIGIDGKVASMLEVGTGFHGELTGRENIYMNGAILGMTKDEIDNKIEDIIDFSDCRQFIDTPVKRYSSGMYVKLAFSVAAHLDSEILIMDEVLAVGDMEFQKKCIDKMNEVSQKESRTILYVSHNMNTIRQLCERCVVLDHGKIIFDGDVEEAINVYLSIKKTSDPKIDLSHFERKLRFINNGQLKMTQLNIDNTLGYYEMGSKFSGKISVLPNRNFKDVYLMFVIKSNGQSLITYETQLKKAFIKNKADEIPFTIDFENLAPGTYSANIFLSIRDNMGSERKIDYVTDCYVFDIVEPNNFRNNRKWNNNFNGYLFGKEIVVE